MTTPTDSGFDEPNPLKEAIEQNAPAPTIRTGEPNPPGPVVDAPPQRALFRCKIAGVPHRKPDLSKLKLGDSVNLVHEPHNAFDPNAIMVLHNGVHLGYIPKVETLYARHLKVMRIVRVEPADKWNEVHIEELP